MPSRNLESFSKAHPSLAPLVKQLLEYIQWLDHEQIDEIIPRVAAAQIGISEGDALGLLSVFQDAGLVKPHYDLVCTSSRSVLASYDSLEELPDDINCPYCGDSHSPDDLRVELVFEIVKGSVSHAAA